MIKKYKQTEIPSVKTFDYYNNKRDTIKQYYKDNLQGRQVTNRHLNMPLHFTNKGRGELAHGRAINKKKIAVLQCLDKLAEVAVFNNFGNRKATDKQNVKGYLNFKAKVFIDGKLEKVRISFVMLDNGKVYYNHEVNIIK